MAVCAALLTSASRPSTTQAPDVRRRNLWLVSGCHAMAGVLVFASGLGAHFTDLVR